ncbi:hypothetical protein AMS68_005589 [Peltaster fructicola]|uniref:Rab-GAP TBC domain-containing protein n=1 Tax=Peltaster fructicola TaxID=286661 RepID=A0A6H0XZ74_9PEZI|nr:hypothetical protein AMS68_005589 [Peltaster fructicola]
MTSLIVPLSIFSTSTSSAHDDLGDDHYSPYALDDTATRSAQHAYLRSPVELWHSHRNLTTKDLNLRLSLPNQRAHHFSLTRYESIEEEEDAMATEVVDTVAIETAPNSPPELSYSKSSKSSSSSLRSSSLDDNDSANESPHFEELSLDESENAPIEHVIEDNNLKPESRPTLRRPQPRSVSSLEAPFKNMMRNSSTNTIPHAYRERKLSAPPAVLQDQSVNLPTGRMMRRGFSYSSPHLAQYAGQRRTSGPNTQDPASMPTSPLSSATITPRASFEGRQLSPAPSLVKRTSWQRKSVAQLEAEFNEDDEDVPEEAILENVPISPMPGQRPISREPSPRRRLSPHSPSYTGMHSANVPKNARRPSAPPLRSPRSPHMRRPPPLQHSNTISAFPPEQQFSYRKKSKSWNDDLNDEVRQLSIALEEHAERRSVDKRPSAPSSTCSTPRRQSDSKIQTRTSTVELPPMQKGNIMIDPLPISKEKEAVLTRTRPSWLPPKSQKEEKKHLREWQQMMARAAQADKKRETKEQETAAERDTHQSSSESVWEHEILLNWGTAKVEARKRELCWQGIAPQSRGAVWKKAVGNELQLSSTSFQAALNRAVRTEEKLDAMSEEELSKSKEFAWFSAIERDVLAAFPALRQFAPGSPANQALSDVLKAYAMYRSDVGYVYGTHLIAGLLCLNMRPGDAFVVLANLLNRPIPLAFLIHDQSSMERAHSMVLNALRRKNKKLHAHLTSSALNLAPEEYLDPLFRCLFAYNLSAAQVSRLWDVYILEDDQVLIDAAVAILGLLEPRLYGNKKEVSQIIGWANQATWEINEESLMTAVKQAKA